MAPLYKKHKFIYIMSKGSQLSMIISLLIKHLILITSMDTFFSNLIPSVSKPPKKSIGMNALAEWCDASGVSPEQLREILSDAWKSTDILWEAKCD